MGEAPERMILVETAEDVEALTIFPEKIAYLTQTTLSRRRRQHRHRRPPASKFPAHRTTRPRTTSATPPRTARWPCANWRRECDLVLVLGSQNSSNSKRLAEIANGRSAPTPT